MSSGYPSRATDKEVASNILCARLLKSKWCGDIPISELDAVLPQVTDAMTREERLRNDRARKQKWRKCVKN